MQPVGLKRCTSPTNQFHNSIVGEGLARSGAVEDLMNTIWSVAHSLSA